MAELIAAVAALTTASIKLAEVITKLGKFLLDAKADSEINHDVESLEKELLWTQAFLKDAENKPGSRNNNLFQIWVAEVSKFANECEDVLTQLISTLDEPTTSHTGCLSLSCCISYNKDLRRTHELSGQIKKLLSDIRDISSRRMRYDPNAEAGNTSGGKNVDGKLMELRRSAPYANNEYMIGRNDTVEHLKTKLVNADNSESFVISILGMGGLGKTTLARKLYNTLSYQFFTTRAWVCVSQEYKTEDILMSLINSMTSPSSEDLKLLTTISLMEAYLREYLSGRCFLVVVDDVWEREAWESLERAFPENDNGSKVIITTRNEHVAVLNNAYVHRLRYLYEDESWELFCRKALPRGTECPSNLEQIGKEMVSKCSGLPLALVVLGGILFKKSLVFSKWKTVRDNLWKELGKDSIHINAILTLSFKDLPECLKPCFLYVAMFPEDYDILISSMMLLWEAEGFITSDEEDGCLGDVAKSYFDELVGRSLFTKIDGQWITSSFRVHDLLRDLAIRKARETGFSLYYDGKGTFDVSLKAPSHRRLTVFHPQNGIPIEYNNASLRTLLIRGPCPTLDEKFRMLRVLEIQIENEFIPNSIGTLVYLQYLSIQLKGRAVTSVSELPDTVGNLRALQTLDIDSCYNALALPKTLLMLTKLKHLIGNFTNFDGKMGSLVCLETLIGISGKEWCDLDTTKLVNLRSLSMICFEEVEESKLGGFYNNFKNVVRLETLVLSFEGFFFPDISLEMLFEQCPSISHLFTNCFGFSNSLDFDKFAVNLQVLEIHSPRRLGHDILRSIEKLPQLEALNIEFPSSDCDLVCSEEGFAQLRTLKIELANDRVLTVEEGCMPLLEHLMVDNPSNFRAPNRLMQMIKSSEGM